MKAGTALLISIRPNFAEQISLAPKQLNWDAFAPAWRQGGFGDRICVRPRKSLVGAFQIAAVIKSTPTNIWKRFGPRTGLKRTDFEAANVEIGYAIVSRIAFADTS